MSQNGGSLWYRARRSHLGVACVVALTLFTDMLTYGAVLPVLPALVIQRLKGDSSTVGFLFGCYAFGLLLATPGFAILSDKYQNRRYPMMAGCIGLIISTLAFAAADSYTLLVLARMAQGVAGGASWTIGLGLLADVFPTHRLGVVMGTVLTAHTVGFAIGPALGGFLYEYGGYSAPFLCCAAFALLNLIAVVWVAEPLHGKVAQRAKGTRDSTPAHDQETASIHSASSSSAVADEDTPLLDAHPKSNQQKPLNMWSMCRNWRIMSCVFCTIVSASVFSGIEPAFPLHLEKVYDASASTVGLLFVAMVVPAFLAPLIGHLSDKLGRNVISATGMIMMAIASPLVAIHYPDVYMIVPSLMVFGLSSPVTLTPVLPEMGEVIADMGSDAYAQVFALYNIAYSAGMFIGPNCAGLVMAYAGFETLMLVFAGTLILCSPVMVKWSAVWHWFTVKLH